MLTSDALSQLAKLKQILQDDLKASEFEKLSAALLSELTGIGVTVAASGFQHGGDGGPAGREGRRFRIETKRYADSTALSNRELLGEIDHAIARDEAIEGWFLISTRSVPEQLENELLDKSERTGVPVIVFDWKSDHFPALAALCTAAPLAVETFAGTEAAQLARKLEEPGRDALERLRREVSHWCLGFESLRTASHRELGQLWSSSRFSLGTFGQNIAAGESPGTVARPQVSRALDDWWDRAETSPALVLGHEGVGKTWATVKWLMDSSDRLPITLLIPASAFSDPSPVTAEGLRRFLAARIRDMVGRQSTEQWLLRLEHLLKRPMEEGPALLLFIDGMNQQPAVQWQKVLMALQMPEFAGRIRVIASTRRFHLEDRLGGLRALLDAPAPVAVGNFDETPGGELDERLRLEGLTREDLGPGLLLYARVPRLFSLVVKFRDRLVETEQVTVHRLLWEYGKDSLGVRAGESFSEEEWRSWLLAAAQDRLDGRNRYTAKVLGERSARPDLSHADIFRRLSDLVDAPFMKRTTDSAFELEPTLVYHALGLALLTSLQERSAPSKEMLTSTLETFLDPIAGLDERAEILRAAVSITIDIDPKASPAVVAALVAAWLSTQNVPEVHWIELGRLAGALAHPLLQAIDEVAASNRAAQVAAVVALRGARKDRELTSTVIQHVTGWIRRVPREVIRGSANDLEADKRRTEALVSLIGTDADGPHVVLGVCFELVRNQPTHGLTFVPALLEGMPLCDAVPAFEALALHQALRGHCEIWDAMKWLVLFNEVDHDATTGMLRATAEDMHSRSRELCIDERLQSRVAALLLWLTGDEQDEPKANEINPPDLYGADHYATQYLADPVDSFFALERRHVRAVLERRDVRIDWRIRRCVAHLPDPQLDLPSEFVADVRQFAAEFDPSTLDTHQSPNRADLNFEEFSVAFARCAPDELAAIHRRKLVSLAGRTAESRFASAWMVTDSFLLTNAASRAAVRSLRLSAREEDGKREAVASGRLMLIELAGMPASEQYHLLLGARLEYISRDIELVLKPLEENDWAELVLDHGNTESFSRDLLLLLSVHPGSIAGKMWDWVLAWTDSDVEALRNIAFRLLFGADGERFGRHLIEKDWNWKEGQGEWVNHFGSLALILGSKGIPFDQVAERLAPWLLLRASRERGSQAAEVELAAQIVDRMLVQTRITVDDPGSSLTISEEARTQDPYSFSITFEPEGKSDLDKLKSLANPEQHAAARRRTAEAIKARIEATRAAGGSLYLRSLAVGDFRIVIEKAPQYIDSWVEGAEDRTTDFKRRVQLSDGAYLALCQALLEIDTARGVMLWKALRDVVSTTFLGQAGLDQMVHAILRAPETDETQELLKSLINLDRLNTDSELLDLTMACAINSREKWLQRVIEEEDSSKRPWRTQRARQLKAFRVGNVDLDSGVWPHGEMHGTTRYDADAFRTSHREAAARHWWRRYWDAETEEDAFAAWTLFLRVVDRRALVWMTGESKEKSNRLVHFHLQDSNLKRAIERNEKDLESSFLSRKTSDLVKPWLSIER